MIRELSYMPERFGEARPPTELYEHEKGNPPAVIMHIDEAAAHLTALLSLPHDNPFLLPFLLQLSILWVVDEPGVIWLGLEEAFDPVRVSDRYRVPPPYLRGIYPGPRPRKLGHGAMLQGAKGRNGGEIILQQDPVAKTTYWEINNRSGRYGSGRTKAQLYAVALEFRKRNINLREQHS